MKLPSFERWLVSLFGSDAEATNFSAHAAWSALFPLVGYALRGMELAAIMALTWVFYSVVNEGFMHQAEEARELALNLFSRLVPAVLVVAVLALFGGS